MPKLPTYNPATKAKHRARIDCINDPITEMEPDELDAWLDQNIKSQADMRALFRKLILAIGALKRK